jgi:type I restriction enzyme M protein
LLTENQIEAIISLPAGCFKPYTGVKTSILFFTGGGQTERVWFYEVTGDGFTLDDKRNAAPAKNDLRFAPKAYRILARGDREAWIEDGIEEIARERSWDASLIDIEYRDLNLTAGVYSTVEFEDVQYESPDVIIDRVIEIESSITDSLTKFKEKIRR